MLKRCHESFTAPFFLVSLNSYSVELGLRVWRLQNDVSVVALKVFTEQLGGNS